jgi:hypothetical protein
MSSIAVLLYKFQKGMQFSAIQSNAPTNIPSPQILGGGSAATRKLFQNEELRIWDLVPRGEHVIREKSFVDCVFYGPVVIAFLNNIYANGLSFDTDDIEKNLIEIKPDRWVVGAYGFENCRLERCALKQVGILGTAEQLALVRAAIRKS